MDSYNSAYSALENRRLAARAKYLAKQEELAEKIPGLSDLSDRINQSAAGYTYAVITKAEETAARLKAEMEDYTQLRKKLLESYGYSEKDLEPVYYCDKCRDTGFVNGKTCSCMKEEIVAQRQKVLTRFSPAPQTSFETFDLNYYSKKAKELSNGTFVVPFNQMKNIFDYCKAYRNNFTIGNKSLLMLGNAGLGKTHLACSIAKVCMEKGFVVMYSSAQSLFSKIEQSRYTDEDILEDILSCDLFILDDLGAENMTNYCLSVLYNIVNTRMIENKPCIYTSNIVSQQALQNRYGEKIASRLLGSCDRLFFMGDDIRIIKNR